MFLWINWIYDASSLNSFHFFGSILYPMNGLKSQQLNFQWKIRISSANIRACPIPFIAISYSMRFIYVKTDTNIKFYQFTQNLTKATIRRYQNVQLNQYLWNFARNAWHVRSMDLAIHAFARQWSKFSNSYFVFKFFSAEQFSVIERKNE